MAASEAKLGMVWCWLQHQKETRTRGAASPRSASPMGPAPTRLPRMALPLLTDHPLVTNVPAAAMAAPASLLQDPQRDDADEPDDASRDGDAVQVPLHDGRRSQGRRDAAAEQVGQSAA